MHIVTSNNVMYSRFFQIFFYTRLLKIMVLFVYKTIKLQDQDHAELQNKD